MLSLLQSAVLAEGSKSVAWGILPEVVDMFHWPHYSLLSPSGELWGKLIYAAINVVQQARTAIEDEKLLRRFTNFVIVFAWASKAKLRDDRLETPSQEGPALVSRGVLEQAELDEISLQDACCWQPYYCLDVMRSVLHEGLCLHDEPKWHYAHKEILLDNTLSALAQSIGGAIRVKATGMPRGYDAGLKCLVVLYCTLANVAWAPSLGWYTPILTFGVYFILWLLLKMGSVLVNPFGVDPVDHPLVSGRLLELIGAGRGSPPSPAEACSGCSFTAACIPVGGLLYRFTAAFVGSLLRDDRAAVQHRPEAAGGGAPPATVRAREDPPRAFDPTPSGRCYEGQCPPARAHVFTRHVSVKGCD